MRRTLHWFWPRAESGIYAEARRLESEGLARSRQEPADEEPRHQRPAAADAIEAMPHPEADGARGVAAEPAVTLRGLSPIKSAGPSDFPGGARRGPARSG